MNSLLPMSAAPQEGPVIAWHFRLGAVEVRFDPVASRLARVGIWKGPGGSYEQGDFDGWQMQEKRA